MKKLSSAQVEMPSVRLRRNKERKNTLFQLSSHAQAKEALELMVAMPSPQGFHLFLVQNEFDERYEALINYLSQSMKGATPADDWVYLNNFQEPNRPLPFRLPKGEAKKLHDHLKRFIQSLKAVFQKMFQSQAFLMSVQRLQNEFNSVINKEMEELTKLAEEKHLNIEKTEDGFAVMSTNEVAHPTQQKDLHEINHRLNNLSIKAQAWGQKIQDELNLNKRAMAKQSMESLINKLSKDYHKYLGNWLSDLQEDILQHIDWFIDGEKSEDLESRYDVNIFVDNKSTKGPPIHVEPNPTYENLFGAIQYQINENGSMETDFRMIRSGALHRAHQGVLIMRADVFLRNEELWEHLKTALREQKIRILDRQNYMLWNAPSPKSIPLDVKIILVGSPYVYEALAFQDTDFSSHFKIQIAVDNHIPLNPKNIGILANLLHQFSLKSVGKKLTTTALRYLIGYGAYVSGDRQKMTINITVLEDIIMEAAIQCSSPSIDIYAIKKSIINRTKRHKQHAFWTYDVIEEGYIKLKTQGSEIGRVNGLSTLLWGERQFGIPVTITAQTFPSMKDFINIERVVDLSGPVQQKGFLVIEAYLKGLFAHLGPLCCGASLTFEQTYSTVEGDSASLAELLSLLSSLSGIAIRQDIAVTGSLNQLGEVQAVGGVTEKIEGFYQVCTKKGIIDTQGVIIPNDNKQNVVLIGDILDAVAKEKFHIWTVNNVEEAFFLIADHSHTKVSALWADVLGRIEAKLKQYQEKGVMRHHASFS